MVVSVSLDRTVNLTKPTNISAAFVTKRLKKAALTTEQLAKSLVLPSGNTFCPAVFGRDGIRTNDAWVSQQVFALDFDNGIAFEDVLKRATDYEIIPNFAYSSFSANETNRKFRVVWLMDYVVTDPRERDVIQDSLLRIFSECDKVCKDASRMYFGGQAVIYDNFTATVSAETLRNAFCSFNEENDIDNASRNITRFAKKHGLTTLNGWPETPQNGRNGGSHYYINNNSCHDSFQNGYLFEDGSSESNAKRSIELLRNVDFHRLADDCPVFNDFMQGIDVHHAVTWTVMCSLLRLKGGEAVFWKGLKLRDEHDERKWERQIKYFKKDDGRYLPGYKYIQEFYPDLETEYANLFQVADSQFGKFRKVGSVKGIPLEEAEKMLEDGVRLAFEMAKAGKPGLVVSNGATGLGKTLLVGKLLEEYSQLSKYVGFPNHALKDEVAERYKHLNPQLVPQLPKEHQGGILERLWSSGLHGPANTLIHSMAAEHPEIKEFLEKKQALVPTGLTLGTHHGALYSQLKYDLIVIDEDWLQSHNNAGTLTFDDFNLILHESKPRAGFRTIEQTEQQSPLYNALLKVNDVLSKAQQTAGHDQVYKMPTDMVADFIENPDLVKELQYLIQKTTQVSSNLIGFLTADQFMFVKDLDETTKKVKLVIKYARRITVPTDSTVLILSATANKQIYENLFGDRMTFIDIPYVETKGKIIQRSGEKLSRAAVKEDPKWYNELQKQHRNLGHRTIGYAFMSEKEDPYFGKLTGFDGFKGQNVAITGTPNLPSWAYVLQAASYGYDMTGKNDASAMEYVVDTINHVETRLMRMQDPIARIAQYAHLNSELVQGAGRARPLREDVIVYVYSNFPIEGAILEN